MVSEDDFDVSLDGEPTSRHLLALILQMNRIRVSEAARQLSVDAGTIQVWSDKLKEDGLIDFDGDIEDPSLKATKVGLRSLKDMGDIIRAQESGGKKAGRNIFEREVKPASSVTKVLGALRAKVVDSWMDLVLVASIALLTYLLLEFIKDPNTEALNFLFASVLLALTLLLYHQYKKSQRGAKMVSFIHWMMHEAHNQRKQIALIVIVWFIIYSVGMLILHLANVGPYILMTVIAASTVHLIYSPRNTITQALKFYVGVTMLTGGLLMLFNVLSLTEMSFDHKVWLIDVSFGAGLLLLAYMNRKTLGLEVPRNPN